MNKSDEPWKKSNSFKMNSIGWILKEKKFLSKKWIKKRETATTAVSANTELIPWYYHFKG